MNDAELMFEFVSLGEDCEFSFIQRRAGAEPLEMLRFAGTTLAELVRGFSESFAAIGHPLHTTIKVTPDKEVWCINRRHDFAQHTFRNPDELDLKAFAAEQCKRLQFLRRKFFEDIEEGEKIFVYKRREPIEQHEVAKLHQWLRRSGPATLLWVVQQDGSHADRRGISQGLHRRVHPLRPRRLRLGVGLAANLPQRAPDAHAGRRPGGVTPRR